MPEAKAVIVTRPDGVQVKYDSQSAAARGEKKDQATISKLCLGKKISCAGFKASFVRDCQDVSIFNDEGTDGQ